MTKKEEVYCKLECPCFYGIEELKDLKKERSKYLPEYDEYFYAHVENLNDFQSVKSRIIEINKFWRNKHPETERYASEEKKEAYRTGTKVETSVERAYKTSISTIIKADVVSLVAAVVLYFLAVGAVRGFALYLGLATILDLVISLYFMRPALIWLASREFAKNNPKLVGMSRPARGDSEGVIL